MRLKDGFLNFAVGPVEMGREILELGAEQLPYFRTKEFSEMNLHSEKLIKDIIGADEKSKGIFLTASGTGAMEAAIMNVFNNDDKLLIINGGSFGERFVEICDIHNLNYDEIKLNYHEELTKEHLDKYRQQGFTGFVVNIHETSTGILYDIDLISDFCKDEDLLLVVDGISSILADDYKMKKHNINVTILSSQKALALPPGLSIIVADEKAIEKINNNKVKSLYFDLKSYLVNGERGQTPFTPAVGILIQLNARLRKIHELGVEHYINSTREIADDFRNRIEELPFKIVGSSMSNALTPLEPLGKMTAHEIFEYLKDNYNIFLCPNGGELRDKLIRVGHIGDITVEHNNKLIKALTEMKEGGLL